MHTFSIAYIGKAVYTFDVFPRKQVSKVFLVLVQDVDPKDVAIQDVLAGWCANLQGYSNNRRIQGERIKGTHRDPVRDTLVRGGDNSNPACPLPHCFPKQFSIHDIIYSISDPNCQHKKQPQRKFQIPFILKL